MNLWVRLAGEIFLMIATMLVSMAYVITAMQAP